MHTYSKREKAQEGEDRLLKATIHNVGIHS